MIICLNAINQENLLIASREKCMAGGFILGWLWPICIKIQKRQYEIKIAAFIHSAVSVPEELW